ncbi:MAG: hypothetical protein Q8Q24_00185 [bacterium]|nr:hypothetical protein [bacterium]
MSKLSVSKLLLIIFLVGFLVYLNSLVNGFVWDDEEQILKNPVVQHFSNLGLVFSSSTFNGGGANPTGWFYRPLMTFSYLVNFSIWGNNPFGFHLFQVLIHLVNACLVFLFFKELFSREKIAHFKEIGFLAGLIFAIHPGISEGVVYIAALQESLYTFFALLVFLLLLNLKRFKNQKLWLSLLSFFGLLSFLSKESAVFLLPLVFLFLLLFLKDKIKLWFLLTLSFFAYLFLRLSVAHIPFSAPNVGPVAESPLPVRLMTIPYEIFSYLRIIFYPKYLVISQHTLINQTSDFRFWGYLILVLFFISLASFYWWKTRSKLFLFFAFWFFGSLSLLLNILPLDMTVAERWLYFPLIGFLGMMSFISLEVWKKFAFVKRYGLYFLIFILIIFAIRTIVRNSNWHDGLTLYGHDIKINGQAFDLENNYGVELFRIGKVEEAKGHFERSIFLYHKWWFAYNNLGAVYERENDLKKAGDLYRKSISYSDYYLAYENLAWIMLKTSPLPESLKFIQEAVSKFPENSKLIAGLALAYYQGKNMAEAEKYAQRAVTLEPSNSNINLLRLIMSKKEIKWN